ncbi:MAG: glycosyltransferase family 2 protein [Pyrinomonadaceae bacterium]
MPVYNGEPCIRKALDSILGQDYKDFELIISDNASTDETSKICREYAARDTRIEYYRTEENMGAVWNFNRVFGLSRGEYFMWAAADDWHAPNYLRLCLACLELDPASVLCFAKTYMIKPGFPPSSVFENLKVDQATPRERFQAFMQCNTPWAAVVYGVIRASALRRTTLLENYYGSDTGLLLQLSLIGPFRRCDETSFYYWNEVKDSDIKAYYKRVVKSLHLGNPPKAPFLPSWEVGGRYLRIVAASSLPNRMKAYLASDVIRYYFLRRTRFMEVFHLIASSTGLLWLRDHLLDSTPRPRHSR